MTNLKLGVRDMGSFSLLHWIIVLFFLFVVGFPVARILGRLGFSKALVVIAFIPLVNWIALWVLAYARWPAVGSEGEAFS